jgi:hypothetical protein
MFRLFLSVVYLALTILATSLIYVSVDSASEPVGKRLEVRIGHSHKGYSHARQLRELQLRDLADGIAHSEIGAYLAVLGDFRNRMLELEAEIYGNFPGSVDDEGLQQQRRDYVKDKTDYLNEFTDSLSRRIEALHGKSAWKDRPRADFVASTKETLIDCSSRAVAHCFHKLTYQPFKNLVTEMSETYQFGIRADLAILSDARGTGLANANDPKWSNITSYAEQHALLNKVREGKIVRDVVPFGGTDAYYFVSAAPIFSGDAYRGAVMVGVQIDDGLVQEESMSIGWDVSYIKGKSLIRSRLSDEHKAEVLNNLPGRSLDAARRAQKTKGLEIQFVPLTGNYSNHDLWAVISGSRDEVMAPIHQIKRYIPLMGIMMFLIGMGLFMWTIRTYTKPLIDIDTGIHEIMNGDHDYEFASDYRDKLWSSMAQSLNRMVGILLGRELEDEDLEEYLGVKTRDRRHELDLEAGAFGDVGAETEDGEV